MPAHEVAMLRQSIHELQVELWEHRTAGHARQIIVHVLGE